MEACIFPPTKERGVKVLKVTPNVYIDRSDFSEESISGFFGVMPGQVVCLRYGPFVLMEDIVKDSSGKITAVKVKVIPNHTEKVKGVIQWVAQEHSIPAQVRLYNELLTCENEKEESKKTGKKWTDFVNPESLIVKDDARVWDFMGDSKEFDRF